MHNKPQAILFKEISPDLNFAEKVSEGVSLF